MEFRLLWKMMRYRSVLTLVSVMTLAVAVHGLSRFSAFAFILTCVSFLLVYASATSFNDLADTQIDAVNLAGSQERPLVTGHATPGRLRSLGVCAAGGALGVAVVAGHGVVWLMFAALVIHCLYSLPPLRLSRHPYAGPLLFTAGFSLLPYYAGVAVAGWNPGSRDLFMSGAIFFLVGGRMAIKDFRDRIGDAYFGKVSFVLKVGKPAAVTTSAVLFAAGLSALLGVLGHGWFLALPALPLCAAGFYGLHRLRIATELEDELRSIGYVIKAGNGALQLVAGMVLLDDLHATLLVLTLFGCSVLALLGEEALSFMTHPEQFHVTYVPRIESRTVLIDRTAAPASQSLESVGTQE